MRALVLEQLGQLVSAKPAKPSPQLRQRQLVIAGCLRQRPVSLEQRPITAKLNVAPTTVTRLNTAVTRTFTTPATNKPAVAPTIVPAISKPAVALTTVSITSKPAVATPTVVPTVTKPAITGLTHTTPTDTRPIIARPAIAPTDATPATATSIIAKPAVATLPIAKPTVVVSTAVAPTAAVLVGLVRAGLLRERLFLLRPGIRCGERLAGLRVVTIAPIRLVLDPVERRLEGRRLAQVERTVVDVLVEGRPFGGVLDRTEACQHFVAANRQLSDLLLHTHGHLQGLARHSDRQPGDLRGQRAGLFHGGDGEAGRNPDGERE